MYSTLYFAAIYVKGAISHAHLCSICLSFWSSRAILATPRVQDLLD